MADFETDKAKLVSDFETLKATKDELETKAEALKAEADELKATRAELESEVEKMIANHAELAVEAEKLVAEKDNLLDELNVTRETNEEISQKLEEQSRLLLEYQEAEKSNATLLAANATEMARVEDELKSLQEKSKPTIESVKESAIPFGLTVLTQAELEELKGLQEKYKPTIESVKEYAIPFDLTVLTQAEFEELKSSAAKPSEVSIDELHGLAENQNMILLTREEYKKLKENPSTATIPVPLPVPVTQTKTVEVVKEITPTDLSQEAERKGFVLVPKDEHSYSRRLRHL